MFFELSIYLMRSQQILVAILLIALTQTKLIDHEQVASGFACCPETYVFDEATLSCVCPSHLPYVNAQNACVSCNAPNYWNAEQKACLSCPANTVYDKVKGSCLCPASLPYVDANGNCVSCPAPAFWNPNT